MSHGNPGSYPRRKFLKHIAAGSASVCAPAFLVGCAEIPAAVSHPPLPQHPFLSGFGVDQTELARVMSELTGRGAAYADIYLQQRRSHSLRLADGVAELPAVTLERGAGLRVVVDGQTGFAATADLSQESLLGAARDAAQIATGSAATAPERFVDVPAGNDFYAIVTHWSEVADERRWPILQEAAAAAFAVDPSISRVTVDWQDSDERILIATLDGQLHSDYRPLTRLSVQVDVQRGNEMHSGFASVSARQGIAWYDAARIGDVAKRAVERALLRFDARHPPLGEMPVVLAAGTSGIVLHEALGHAFEADFSLPGTGPYAGRLGEQIAAPLVTLVDDATMPHERGALNIDDEGTNGQRTVLIERGILRSFLHDRSSAADAGVAPTGSGRRESFRHAPLPRMSCTQIMNGNDPIDDLLLAAGRGLLAETYSAGQVDPASGDFTFRINSGWFIDNGKRSFPVRDLSLSGNGPELLLNVQQLANDGRMDEAGWTCGKRGQRVPVSHGTPSALVTGLRISE